MKSLAMCLCLFLMIGGIALAEKKITLQLKYKDGRIMVDDTVCPSEKGKKQSMLQIRQGKAHKLRDKAYNEGREATGQAVYFRVDMITDRASDDMTREFFFPMAVFTSHLEPGARETTYGEYIADVGVAKIELPYKPNMRELRFTKLGKEDSFSMLAESPPLILMPDDFQDKSDEFVTSAEPGYFYMKILGCGYEQSEAGLAKFVEEALITAVYVRAQPPMDQFTVLYNWPHRITDNFFDQGCGLSERGAFIADRSCVICHAEDADEVIVLADCEGNGLPLDVIGATGLWECSDDFIASDSTESFCTVTNGKWPENPLQWLDGAMHEGGHSMYGLRDERAPEGSIGQVTTCDDINCCNSGTTGCYWNSGSCGNVCRFETPTLGCIFENMGTCSDLCLMQHTIMDDYFCPRCWDMGRRRLRIMSESNEL